MLRADHGASEIAAGLRRVERNLSTQHHSARIGPDSLRRLFMSRTFFAGLAISVALMGCSHDDPINQPNPPIADRPRMAIVDRTNGGDDTFRWLPPIVATSDYEGTNDGAAAPIVEICVQGVSECTVFATSGTNLPTPTAVAGKKEGGAYFTTSWNTRLYSLDPSKVYRILVRVGAKSDGFADVDVVSTRADLATVQPGFAGVALGDELEINFRIVRGVTRTWQGGATDKGKDTTPGSTTEWANAANWSPEGIPFRLDTAIIAAVANQPVLAANTAVGRVKVNDAATLAIGAFNLTVNAGATTINTGQITATSGLLLLSGAGTIAGSLPHFVVTGSYALAGNVLAPATARVDGGRLNTAGWLLRVTP